VNSSSSTSPKAKKCVLVTGAAKRVGQAIAIHFAEQGWDVAVHFGQSKTEADETVAAIQKLGSRAMAFQADLASEPEIAALFQAVTMNMGALDCIVNSASQFEYDRASAEPELINTAFFQKMMQVNVLAPVLLAQLLYRQQKSRAADSLPTGDIPAVIQLLDQKLINLNPDYFSYTLSKGALECASQMMAMDFAPYLRVVGLAPGISLPSGPQSEDGFKAAHTMTPLKRSSTPVDIAKAAVFIAESNAITGTTIYVDGGQHLMPSSRDVMFKTEQAL
jgi:NAD(P)-dependent dehydrogenase (short-subunit alcohol dehydrogenase family)